jgi:anti-sigma-K factor RskA
MTDPFIHDDAAYVLGALDPERRAAFERHLDACPDCRARVQQAASVLPALASVPVEAFDPVPETLLPGLMRRAAASRRRNRYLFSAVVGAAAACLAALVLVVWPRSTPQPASRPMAAVIATPVRASAALQAKPWGTEIELHCSYVGRVPATAYLLQVDDRAGHSQTLGTWRLVPGRETQYVSGTALRPEQISRVEVVLPDGRAVLRLDL